MYSISIILQIYFKASELSNLFNYSFCFYKHGNTEQE